MAVNGHYIGDADVSNWPDGLSEAGILLIIKSVEERIHKLTKDFFYPKVFGVNLDGSGENLLNLNLIPNILSISGISLSGASLSTSYYTHDRHSVFLDSSAANEAELRYLLRRAERTSLFPRGYRNIYVSGTYGWPERLDIDNVSGVFQVKETITGGDSDATAVVNAVEDDHLMVSGRSSTNFSNNEEITGGTSEATADVDNTSGAENSPPDGIKEACVISAMYRNDDALYTPYTQGSESGGGISVSTKEKPLVGLREADVLLRPYVRKKVRMLIA